MTREEARQYIIQRGKEHLTPDRSGKGFICPICGSGSGIHGTGITTKDGVHFTCWTGCFTNIDIIDIIGLETGTTNYNSKLQAAAAEYGITLDKYNRNLEYFAPVAGEHKKQARSKNKLADAEPNYTDFFLQAAKNIDKTDYHRGLSSSTLTRFNVGFVENWRHPKAPKMEASPRLIIPTSQHSYLARYAGAGDYINFSGQVENKSKVGKVRIFNPQAVQQTAKPIFIVEGEIDAMSIVEVGGEALGMGSKGNVQHLTALLENNIPTQPLIIALDNEQDPIKQKGVEQSAQKIVAQLQRLGIHHYRENIIAQYKDANEALMADRKAFTAAVNRAIDRVKAAEAEAIGEEQEQLHREAVAYSLCNFLKSIEDSKRDTFIPTGYSHLDNILDGGLYAGLYIIGAISSLGKTTFCLNIADNIAQAGHDVLIFSLEMARNELIAKSISRLTFVNDLAENGSIVHAKTTRGIVSGARYHDYNQTERDLIQRSIAIYGEYARNIYITEGMGNMGIEKIREKVRKYIRLMEKPLVVIIDYLQIISPADIRATDKQNTDKAVLELKRLSRDFNIPIIGISSFNRDSYTAPVNMAAFKESGAIEYSSDVLIGLQYEGMDYQEGETDKAREKRIREIMKQAVENGKAGEPQRIQVKVLKNRNGSKGDVYLDFYPMFNCFTAPRAEERGDSRGNWSKSESSYSTKPSKSERET